MKDYLVRVDQCLNCPERPWNFTTVGDNEAIFTCPVDAKEKRTKCETDDKKKHDLG